MDTKYIDFKKLMQTSSTGKYTIPSYQRPYSWGKNQWQGIVEDFVKMIKDFLEGNAQKFNNGHFLGAVVRHVFSAQNDENHYIVDGQQRMITMSLLNAAWLNVIADLYGDHTIFNAEYHERYSAHAATIFSSLFVQLETIPSHKDSIDFAARILPLPKDQQDYSQVLTELVTNYVNHKFIRSETWKKYTKQNYTKPINPFSSDTKELKMEEPESKGRHHPISRAYGYLYWSLRQVAEDILSEFIDGKRVPELDRNAESLITETFRILEQQFKFVTITVPNNERPQEIFESLNARSVPLTCFDLIKNYMLMSVDLKSPEEMNKFYDLNWKHFEEGLWLETIKDKTKHSVTGKIAKADYRTIFLNYWNDANVLIAKLEHPDDKEKYFTARKAKNSEERFASNDDTFWVYRRHMENMEPSEIRDFNEKLSFESKVFKDLVEATTSKYFLEILEEARGGTETNHFDNYESLNRLNRSFPLADLLTLIDRCINKMKHHSLWKVVIWTISNRERVPTHQMQEIISTLESWIMRRELVGKFTQKTPEGITMILDFLNCCINLDEAPVNQGNGAPMSARIEKRLKSYLRSDLPPLKWPTDPFMLEYSADNSKASLELIKIVLVAVENNHRGFTSLTGTNVNESAKRFPADAGCVTRIIPQPKDMPYDWPISDPNQSMRDIIKSQEKITSQIGNFVLLANVEVPPLTEKEYEWIKRKEDIKGKSGKGKYGKLLYNLELIDSKNWDISSIQMNTKEIVKVFNKLWPND